MPCADFARQQSFFYRLGRAQQTQSVGDGDAALADPLSYLPLGHAKFVDQLAKSLRFFQRI